MLRPYGSLLYVVGHTDDDHSRMEQQGCLDPQGSLIVNEVLTPVSGHVLGEDDRDGVFGMGFSKSVEVREKGANEGAIGRLDDDEGDLHAGPGPCFLECFGALFFVRDMD